MITEISRSRISSMGRSVDHAGSCRSFWDEGSRYDDRSFGCADQLWIIILYWMPWRWRCEAADGMCNIYRTGNAPVSDFCHLYVTVFMRDLFMEEEELPSAIISLISICNTM